MCNMTGQTEIVRPLLRSSHQCKDSSLQLITGVQEQNWKLSGIVNGIDNKTWNPKFDDFLTSDGYTQYSQENLLEGKAANKKALQNELGLPENPDVPMLGFIGRMDYQKGVDFIVGALQVSRQDIVPIVVYKFWSKKRFIAKSWLPETHSNARREGFQVAAAVVLKYTFALRVHFLSVKYISRAEMWCECAESFPWLMGEGVQLVMLGSGRDDLESELRNMENQRKDQCRCAPSFFHTLCLCRALCPSQPLRSAAVFHT